jgi:DNA-binding MarR family transcriptional regulator
MHNELYRKMTQLQWLLHRQQIRKVAAGGPLADTSRGQGRILSLLKLQDGVSTKDLAYLLGIRVSSLNELLAKLERGGYILREQSEADGRVSLVKLTDKGRSEQASDIDANDLLSCLSAPEQANFSDYLDRIIAVLEAEDEPLFTEFPHPPVMPGFPMPPFPSPGPMFGHLSSTPEEDLIDHCLCKYEDCECYRDCRACRQKHHFSGTQTACGK